MVDLDYKEVIKKDGTRLVFCNLEELVQKFYESTEVEQYVNSTGEYIIHCPFCKEEGHTKHKLYIKDDFSVGHCFVCGRAYINVSDEVNINFQVPKFNMFWGNPGIELPIMKSPDWTLDKFKYEFDDFSEIGYNYLLKRHGFFKDLYKDLGFKFWEDNVVMPFYYHNELVYYQIRFTTGNSKIRYFFPPVTNKIPYIIDHKVPETRLIICEGVYDAVACLIMAPDFIPIAVLGSSISDYQLEFIKEYTPIKEILVYLDETKLSAGIANRLKQAVFCPIGIIKSDGEDPEENMKRRLKCHSELQWIKPRVM